ncbi:hypothetical protein Q5H93_01420 [Hymenobacter sp. ASUV-10]|uniref:Uncharacterized protein n=1 Tax=Hymenobacter aranciens TaxID=3063996 RepID=A0ABT9B8N9_9BACT|nr:hypothetical protein [Hymenobacter sp. ASUV-10]MDO7873372.1 hypothetical protein [Hymenobacter sp. ASUV-10]
MFKLIESYVSLTNDAVSPFAHSVVRQTSTSSLITDGLKLAQPLLEAVTAYDDFINNLGYGSPSNTTIADTLRDDVKRQLGRLAKQLNLTYENKEATLQSSGLKMANPNTAQRPDGDGQFNPVIVLTDGSTPGCLLITFEGFTGSVQRLVRFTTDPTLDPKHWEVAVGNGRSREIGAFPSGTKVYVMAAPLTSTTTDPIYSPVVSRIVQ